MVPMRGQMPETRGSVGHLMGLVYVGGHSCPHQFHEEKGLGTLGEAS